MAERDTDAAGEHDSRGPTVRLEDAGTQDPERVASTYTEPARQVQQPGRQPEQAVVSEMLGRYRIVKKLAKGGMGEVFEGHDTQLGRPVAIKMLPESMLGSADQMLRFEREARVVASLNHPNIVTLYSVEEADGRRFIVMELVRGRSLDAFIPPGGCQIDRFLALARALSDGLGAAHERGVTHRDLKPSNIMISESGRLKILDFGIAKLHGESAADATANLHTLTHEGALIGTLPYMSPEQAQGRAVDSRSDIFSLGVVFYQLLTGRNPFAGDNMADIISAILRDQPTRISEIRRDIPDGLGRIIERCMDKDLDRRYANGHELWTALQDVEALAVDSRPSTAVLPFTDLSGERDQGYFCEGIAEELIGALVTINNLRVASRMASFGLRDEPLPEIGQRLNVSTVLTGSVRKAGQHIRVSAQLVDIDGQNHLWSARYDRKLEDIFAIQDDIAANIVEALRVTFGTDIAGSTRKAAPIDVQAYDYYLRGRQSFYQVHQESLVFARQMFARATIIAPTDARFYAGVANCCSYLYQRHERRDDDLREAEIASRRAVEIDPDSAEAHASRGFALSQSTRHDEARSEFERAIRLDPRLFDANYFFARFLFSQGELAAAAAMFEKASEIDPEHFPTPALLAQVYLAQGRQEDSRRTSYHALELIRRHLVSHPEDTNALCMGASFLIEFGDRGAAYEWVQEAVRLDTHGSLTLYNAACVYALLGDVEQAIDYLERSNIGVTDMGWLENDPELDALRDHPRFVKYIESLAE